MWRYVKCRDGSWHGGLPFRCARNEGLSRFVNIWKDCEGTVKLTAAETWKNKIVDTTAWKDRMRGTEND